VLYVHGSARNPLNEYVFPEDIYNPRKLERIGAVSGALCFAGHTHIPGVFRQQSRASWEFLHPEECERGLPVRGEKLIVNVGSVGQPRDDDERACYVVFDGERLRFRRVDYDYKTTARKIYAIPELDDIFGDRLREGR
jgi:diadenosine tetraphosphatase ApaH/serine/threonine PP2A family protein phosphatase